MKLGETEAAAMNEMDRGMGRCRLFKIQRGGPVGSLHSRENMEMCSLLQCCFHEINLLNVIK